MALLPVALVPVYVVFGLYGIFGHTELISWLVALGGGCDPHLSPGLVIALNCRHSHDDGLPLCHEATAAGMTCRLI